jgi:hypothetical protein
MVGNSDLVGVGEDRFTSVSGKFLFQWLRDIAAESSLKSARCPSKRPWPQDFEKAFKKIVSSHRRPGQHRD